MSIMINSFVSWFTFSPLQKHFYDIFHNFEENWIYWELYHLYCTHKFYCTVNHITLAKWTRTPKWICTDLELMGLFYNVSLWCINNDGRKPITCILESNSTSILYMGTTDYLLIVLKEQCVKSFHIPLLICLYQESHMIHTVKE